MKNTVNGKKIRIHAITYVLVVVFLALIVTAIILFTPSNETYFKKRYNNEVLRILSDSKDNDGKNMQNYYSDLRMEKDTEKMFKILKPKQFADTVNKNKNDLLMFVRGGYYSKEFLLQFNLFLKEYKEHELYTNKKYFNHNKPVVVNVIMQSSAKDYKEELDKKYNEFGVDKYDYDDNVKAPIITFIYRGKAVNLDLTRDQLFENVPINYKEINTRAKTYLDNMKVALDALIK